VGLRTSALEDMVNGMTDYAFWRDKSVFLTGHTGFKGAWLSLWLQAMGSRVTGYALAPPTEPSLYAVGRIGELIHSVEGDVRDYPSLRDALLAAKPDIVIHMAAQPLVRESYRIPVGTYEVNVMGTVHLLEAVREAVTCGIPVKAVVNVTTDKSYDNREWAWGYRETDPLGGFDPYSSSKACAELVTAAYRNSYFHPDRYGEHSVAVATARAGNVIGGGDWAADRLIPDCIRSLSQGEPVSVRRPEAIRPWQHVLVPLSGYLLLAERLFRSGPAFASAWNFGPQDEDARPVAWIVHRLCERWGPDASYRIEPEAGAPHEARYLKLDCSKARLDLGWRPAWDLDHALAKIAEWNKAYRSGKDIRFVCMKQIREYMGRERKR